MEDYHVDRRQVQGRRRPSRAVLIARACSFAVFLFFLFNLSHDIRRGYGGPSPGGDTKVAMAAGSHLFPSRTEKLSPLAPMVLPKGGRVGSRRPGPPRNRNRGGFFYAPLVPPSSRPYSPGRAFPRRKARRCAPECIPGGAAVPFAVGKHARAPRPGRRACGLASRSGRGGHACDQSHVQFLASVSRKGTQKS